VVREGLQNRLHWFEPVGTSKKKEYGRVSVLEAEVGAVIIGVIVIIFVLSLLIRKSKIW
jgi:hypothetical protein